MPKQILSDQILPQLSNENLIENDAILSFLEDSSGDEIVLYIADKDLLNQIIRFLGDTPFHISEVPINISIGDRFYLVDSEMKFALYVS